MAPEQGRDVTLLELLGADAARHLECEGEGVRERSALRLLRALSSPRFAPVVLYRLSYASAGKGWTFLAKALSMVNFVAFGLEIGTQCQIGPGLVLPHTQGTVIGARVIGSNATIYHQVTIGAKRPDLAYTPQLRPTIGDDVLIGAGAKILGSVEVGDGSVIAANAVVSRNVAPGVLARGVPAVAVGPVKRRARGRRG